MSKRIIMVLLSMILCAGLIVYTRQNAFLKFRYDQYEQAAQILRLERSEVERELKEVKQKLREIVLGEGSFLLLFEESDERIYTEVLPILTEHDYVGVLALSPQSYPGKEGCITKAQFDELLSVGWETCLCWEANTKIDDYLKEMEPVLKELDIECPTVIEAAARTYQPYKDEMLSDAGFTTVIHHGETGEIVAREDSEEVFHVGAVGWNSVDAVTAIKNVIQYGGSLVLGVDFSESPLSGFQKETFAVMCNNLKGQDAQLHPTTMQGLRENLGEATANNYYSARKSYLEAELERHDREIEAIYQLDLEELETK